MNRTDKLWKALRLRGASPMPPAAAVQKRIDQALGENSRLEERRKQMKMRKKAAALALAATTLTGAAWAVNQFNVLDAVFEGDTTIAQPMADNQPRQVSDGNFTLTVASSVSDGRTAYLLVQVEATRPRRGCLATNLFIWIPSAFGPFGRTQKRIFIFEAWV